MPARLMPRATPRPMPICAELVSPPLDAGALDGDEVELEAATGVVDGEESEDDGFEAAVNMVFALAVAFELVDEAVTVGVAVGRVSDVLLEEADNMVALVVMRTAYI